MDISKIMTTDEGVQIVCQGVSGSISKYYLEEPLYPYLRDLLSFDLPRNPEVSRNRTDQKGKCNLILQMIAPLDNLTKINLLQKLATSILPQVSQQLQLFEDENPYILPDPPSPLITEPPDSPTYPIPNVSEPDVFLPTFPSSPRTESYYSRSESY